MREQEYLAAVTTQIRSKTAKQYVEDELKNHIEERAEENQKNGMTEREAMEEAVIEMGDPIEVGVEMDRLHKPKMNWKFILFILGLSILSVAIHWRFSSNYMQPIYTMLSIGIMIAVCYMDYSILGKHATTFVIGFLLMFVIAFTFFPLVINGGVRWAGTAHFSVSLWSLLHLYPPIYGAFLYSCRGKKSALFTSLILLITPVLFALYMPAFSLAIGLFFVLLLMLSVAVAKGWIVRRKKTCLSIMWGTAIGLPICGLLTLFWYSAPNSYQVARVISYFNKNPAEEFENYKIHEYLDNQNATNYLVRFLMKYYGVTVGIILVTIIVFMIVQVFHISMKQKNQLGMMIGIGCGLVFATQTFSYLLLNLGILRSTDVYLPLFSYGANGTIISYVLLGLVLSVFRYQDILPQTIKKARWKIVEVSEK